jgi:predicted secreted protein
MRPRVAWTTLAGIYFVLWWTVLFAVLPFGVRSQEETGEIVPGSDPGAPSAPKLLVKALWTTIVTTAIFLVFYAVYAAGLIDLEQFGTLWGLFPR